MDNYILTIYLTAGLLLLQIIWFITDPRPLSEVLGKKNNKTYGLTTIAEVGVIVPQIISGLYFPLNFSQFNSLVILTGISIYLFGLIFAIWAKFTMKRNWGIPASHDIKRQNELVTSGPYKYSRNPIYVGLLAIAIGFSITFRSYFIFLNIFLFLYFNNAIKTEEGYLQKYFGDRYTAFKSRIPRYL